MKRYSMEQRDKRVNLTTKFTDEEKYQIMYDYMIRKFKLRQIHNNFRDRCSLTYFLRLPSLIFDHNRSVMNSIFEKMMSPEDYQRHLTDSAVMGAKVSSYYPTEEDCFYKEITVNDLSDEELRLNYE